VGKTQIALEFAFQLQERSPDTSIFWISATDIESFEKSYLAIGIALQIPELGSPDTDVKTLVKSRLALETTGKWIIIIDNADDSDLVHEAKDITARPLNHYLPYSPLGGILFTTRGGNAAASYVDAGSNIIDIEEMNDSESRKLLERSLHNKQLISDLDETKQLLMMLVNLPLAIIQAASYLNSKRNATITQYLEIFQESDKEVIELLSKGFGNQTRYSKMQNPIATTWLISFQQIRRQAPLAAEFMSFISCIKEQDIPEDILPEASLSDRTDALGTLIGFGFLRPQIGGKLYNMHQLVHLAVRNWLENENKLSTWTSQVLQRLITIIPMVGYEKREKWKTYLPHGIHVAKSPFLPQTMEIERILLLDRIDRCQKSIGQYEAAERSHRRVLELMTERVRMERPDTFVSMNETGRAFMNQGKYAVAETISRNTLASSEKELAKELPRALTSTRTPKQLDHSAYTIAWICTLEIELDAATELLDELHPNLKMDPLDRNPYKLGRLGPHNIVIACLRPRWYGSVSAATTTIHMMRSFPMLKVGVLVGIGGGVPSATADVRLGDVVVSMPHGDFGGVVAWDIGKALPGNLFVRTGESKAPFPILVLAARRLMLDGRYHDRFESALLNLTNGSRRFRYPESEPDELYQADYPHEQGMPSCRNCDKAKVVARPTRGNHSIQIHYGTVASGDQVMKDGMMRDRISQSLGGVLCFEMEAAGVMNTFPCLIVRGICDYSDSHKNDTWQSYASATAAAYAKCLLLTIDSLLPAMGGYEDYVIT
jgi:nucleoside phosphorylase